MFIGGVIDKGGLESYVLPASEYAKRSTEKPPALDIIFAIRRKAINQN